MLKINNLTVKYDNLKILDNLCVSFEDCSIIGIIGKNGSGKSTLLKAIEGITKYDGEITLNEKSISKLSIKDKAKEVAYLPQNRNIPQISAKLMIEHGRFPYLSFTKTLSKSDKEIINKAIAKTNVQDLLNKKLSEMSGGELQKIYITSTIVQNTSVILLDEPTNHLDLESQIEILNILKELKKENKIIIIVLHDLLQAFTYCDKVVLLDNKKIILEGSPESIYNNKLINNTFKYGLAKDDNPKAIYKYRIIK